MWNSRTLLAAFSLIGAVPASRSAAAVAPDTASSVSSTLEQTTRTRTLSEDQFDRLRAAYRAAKVTDSEYDQLITLDERSRAAHWSGQPLDPREVIADRIRILGQEKYDAVMRAARSPRGISRYDGPWPTPRQIVAPVAATAAPSPRPTPQERKVAPLIPTRSTRLTSGTARISKQ